MFRVFLSLLLVSQVILLYVESLESGLYALVGQRNFLLIVSIAIILALSRLIIKSGQYFQIVICSFLFLPFLGASPAHLCSYILFYPLIFSTTNSNYKRIYYILVSVLVLSFLVRNENTIYLLTFSIGREGFNFNSILEILKLSRNSFSTCLDFCIIGSFPLFIDEQIRKNTLKSFLYICPVYVLVSAVFIYFQQKGMPIFSLNQNAFWVYVNRYSGIASDPNALGLVLGLMSMVIVLSEKLNLSVKALLLFFILAVSQFSGSRSFYLLFVFSLILKLFTENSLNVPKKKLLIYSPLIFFIIIFIGISVKGYFPDQSSIKRFIDTIDPKSIVQMFESRATFLKIAWEGIKERPFLGYGLQGFYDNQMYLGKLAAVELGEWRDNSNNFYLELILTFGIPLSLYFLYWLYTSIRLSSILQRNAKYFAILILLSLITGPHVYFMEYSVIVLILLSGLFTNSSGQINISRKNGILLSLFIFCIAGHFVFDSSQSLGLYPLEPDSTRWLGRRAHIKLCSSDTKVINLTNYNPNTEIQYVINSLHRREEVGAKHFYSYGTIKPGESKIIDVTSDFTFLSKQTWTPSQVTGAKDSRLISLKVKWPSRFPNCL